MRSALEFSLPSLVAALAAATVAGLVEGALYADGASAIAVAAGSAAPLSFAAGALLSVVARGLWRAWRPASLADALTEETGSAPRLGAWLLYAVVAVAILGEIALRSVLIVLTATKAPDLAAAAIAPIVVATALGLAIVALPVASLLARALRAIDRRLSARGMPAALRPRNLVIAGAVLAAGYAAFAWYVEIRPRLGALDLGLLPFGSTFVIVLVGSHLVWPHISSRRARAAVGAGVALLAIACTASALHARHRRPFALLDVWGRAPVAGFAIGALYDLELIRAGFPLDELRSAARPGADHPTIILVTIDTFRADRSSIYGGPARTVALDRLADRGSVFAWAMSPGNVTRRSLPTIATGISPRRIRGRVAGWALRLDPRHVMLAERFAASGYDTAGFFCCVSQFGPHHHLGPERGVDHMVFLRDAPDLIAAAVQWLRARDLQQTRRPALVWIHIIEPHSWERGQPAHGRHGPKAKYDAVIEDVDRALLPLVELVTDPARRDRVVIAVTSDHGEGLGDHDSRTHAATLYNSEIRVPLIVSGAGVRTQRLTMPVGLVDLAPTLLDLAGFEPPGMPEMDGRSVAPYLRGEIKPRPGDGEAYSVMIADRSVRENAWALVHGRYKLILAPDRPPELYDIQRDPDERSNIARTEPAALGRLRERLEARRRIDRLSPFAARRGGTTE